MSKNQNSIGNNRHKLVYLDPDPITLEDLGTSFTCAADTVLNSPGEIPEFCYYVKKGRVICCDLSDSGELVFDYLDSGSLFLEEYILSDRPAPVVFRTLIDSELIRIDSSELLYAYHHSFSIATEICESLADKLTKTIDHVRMDARMNASWKICRMLIFFAQNYGRLTEDGMIRIDRSLSQQKLADILGMNRVTVTKKLKELRELGLIEVRSRQFYLPNVDLIVDYMVSIQEERNV